MNVDCVGQLLLLNRGSQQGVSGDERSAKADMVPRFHVAGEATGIHSHAACDNASAGPEIQPLQAAVE